MQTYEIIVQDAMAKRGYRGFINFPVMQRNWDTPDGTRMQATVYMFRITVADAAAWWSICRVLIDGWPPAIVTVRVLDAKDDFAQAELEV